MKIPEGTRVMLGAFALYWADKVLDVVHFHPAVIGLGTHSTVLTLLVASVLFTVVAAVIWLVATYCVKALMRWHLRRRDAANKT
jgi:hypothetical protein